MFKKVFVVSLLSLGLLLSGFASTGSLLSPPEKAEAASTSSWLYQVKRGYFTNYVITPTYKPNFERSKGNQFVDGFITAKSSAKGTFKLYVQYKSGNSWKTIETVTAKKNGSVHFQTDLFKINTPYRFKLVNQGTKKRVDYVLQFNAFGSKY